MGVGAMARDGRRWLRRLPGRAPGLGADLAGRGTPRGTVGDADTAKDRVGPVLDAVAGVQTKHPQLYIAEAGDASSDKLIGDDLDAGLNRLSMLSIPVTLGGFIALSDRRYRLAKKTASDLAPQASAAD